MSIAMPKPSEAVLSRREEIVSALRVIVPGEGVVDATNEMKAFESDGLTAYRQLPLVVVLPDNVGQVSRVLKYCHENDIPVVPRGAGTSLSGGALPLEDGVLLVLSKFNKVLDIDFDNRCAVVQPGVTNLGITKAVEHRGFYYAPDPSSQIACSIGGNIAENSGGVHCLKYGLTANNVLGIEFVTIEGEIVRLGGKHLDADGHYDMLGLMTGSEGLLGVVTEVTVRILQAPETARAVLIGFPSSEQAGECVASIIAKGIIPGGMEMMDRPAIHAAEDFVNAGYPRDVEALLIVELDGPKAEVDHLLTEVEAIAGENGATTTRVSQNEEERAAFWAGRKAAFPAVGRISPDYYCMDGTIPRKELPKVLAGMKAMEKKYGLKCANVFHAGDGNLHPLVLYDANAGELERAEEFGNDILKLCVEVGGVLTGEHGVGVEKRDLMPEMFSETDMNHQQRVKCTFDAKHLLNPGKVFPQLHRCAELGRMHVHKGEVAFPDLPRF
ncbi:ATPase, E1-E2 type:FAD linked oxidase, C-terminal:FAD linked oxidase, N-terminal [Fulvimarina pelagi HTCC2506]|uniref:ATPase, E1-E2 type:FAD linked oxidase, C-terminal:FAD linked oxidase, N-terminal n=1 Tax=Fulvimarina pelagi HTCC2506 TaxID=314231 RepID=Q0G3W8_9HYPH|nr:FAD-linked oxidase C-terminal domain-containing protein [Fulvimarina pelagi]EAU41713.1 ATPase, E1-E2 type:FAD linked oxidase, C-terminal:FAD linked oxidase, N-terminal [Fulvimarina pelagi HTCC2506]